MHIPDGYLGPQTFGALYVAMAPFWYRALKRVQMSMPKKHLPLMAIGGAFSFAVQMFNVPVPGGTTAHMVGGALLGVVLGPWAALISISTALLIQALVFGDGGITTLAANTFTMGLVMPFSAFYVYRLIAGRATGFSLRHKIGAFLAGYLSLSLAAIVTGLFLGLQPIIAGAGGRPLYAPYPLSVTIPAMAVGSLLFAGLIEGAVTTLVLAYLDGSSRAIWPGLGRPPIFNGQEAGNREKALLGHSGTGTDESPGPAGPRDSVG